jgi:hypothetical protein
MSYNLSISKIKIGSDERAHHVLPLSDPEEYRRANLLCRDKKNMAGIWQAALMPIRTDLTHFISDVLFPLSHMEYSPTKNLFHFTALIAFVGDVGLIPLRLLTLFPRACYNAMTSPSPHPLSVYLQEKGVDPFYLQGEVEVRVYKEQKGAAKIALDGHLYQLHLANHEVPFIKNMTEVFYAEHKV